MKRHILKILPVLALGVALMNTSFFNTVRATPENNQAVTIIEEENDDGELEAILTQINPEVSSLQSVVEDQTETFNQETNTSYFTFTYNDNDMSAEITGYDASGGSDVVIPNHVIHNNKKYIIRSIGPFAMVDKGIKSLFIPDTITTLKRDAFKKNKNLKSVVFENWDAEVSGSIQGLTFERAVFYWCYGMDSIVLPKRTIALDYTTFSRSTIKNVYFTSTKAPSFAAKEGFPQYKANVVNMIVPKDQASDYINNLSDSNAIRRSNNASVIYVTEQLSDKNYAQVGTAFDLIIPATYAFDIPTQSWSQPLSFNIYKNDKSSTALAENLVGPATYTIPTINSENSGKYVYYNGIYNKEFDITLNVFQ